MKKLLLIVCIMNVLTNIGALDINLDIGDEENALNIEKYIEYLKQRNMELDKIQEEERKLRELNRIAREELTDIFSQYLDSKVYCEFHLGLSEQYHFEKGYAPYCNLSVKFNILNPKRIGNHEIMSLILSLEELLNTNNIELSESNQMEIDKIKEDITTYDKKIFKRISVGLSVPYYPALLESEYTEAYLIENDIVYLGWNFFFVKDLSFFISADFTDYITVQVGYDIVDFNSFYIGVSTDFSTPISSLATRFLHYIEDLIYH